jgi:hypothetical protein
VELVPGGSQVSQRLARSQMRRAGREQVVIEDGSRPVCSFGVTAGRGSCLLTDTALGVGIGRLTAYAYPNNGSLTAAASASHALTIVKGSDTTTLTLSKAVVAFGHENATKLSVRVLTRYHGFRPGAAPRDVRNRRQLRRERLLHRLDLGARDPEDHVDHVGAVTI